MEQVVIALPLEWFQNWEEGNDWSEEEEEEGERKEEKSESISEMIQKAHSTPLMRAIQDRWDNCRRQCLQVCQIDIGEFDYNPFACMNRLLGIQEIDSLRKSWLLVFFYGAAQQDPQLKEYHPYIQDVVEELAKDNVFVGHHIGIFQKKTTPFLDSIRNDSVINVSNTNRFETDLCKGW